LAAVLGHTAPAVLVVDADEQRDEVVPADRLLGIERRRQLVRRPPRRRDHPRRLQRNPRLTQPPRQHIRPPLRRGNPLAHRIAIPQRQILHVVFHSRAGLATDFTDYTDLEALLLISEI